MTEASGGDNLKDSVSLSHKQKLDKAIMHRMVIRERHLFGNTYQNIDFKRNSSKINALSQDSWRLKTWWHLDDVKLLNELNELEVNQLQLGVRRLGSNLPNQNGRRQVKPGVQVLSLIGSYSDLTTFYCEFWASTRLQLVIFFVLNSHFCQLKHN